MIEFTHIKYGLCIALVAILFGGSLGLSFGCCEEPIKKSFNESAQKVLQETYEGNTARLDKTVKKSWVYMKRAHLHSQTMGVIAIVFSLLVAWIGALPKFQMGVSILGGLGSLGYGMFWLLAGWLAPGMGSTHAAKEAVGLIAQFSGGAFFVMGLVTFGLVVLKMFRPGHGVFISKTAP